MDDVGNQAGFHPHGQGLPGVFGPGFLFVPDFGELVQKDLVLFDLVFQFGRHDFDIKGFFVGEVRLRVLHQQIEGLIQDIGFFVLLDGIDKHIRRIEDHAVLTVNGFVAGVVRLVPNKFHAQIIRVFG